MPTGSNGAYGGAGQPQGADPAVRAESVALASWRARVERHRAQAGGSAGQWRPAPHVDGVPPELPYLQAIVRPSDIVLLIEATAGVALPLASSACEVIALRSCERELGEIDTAARERGINNLTTVCAAWPAAAPPRAHVVIAAYVLHDCADIGPFLEAMELTATRTCVAVLGVDAPRSSMHWLWQEVHGEPYARLPALAEFVALLQTRGMLFDLRIGSRGPVSYGCRAEAVREIRARLGVAPGTEQDRRLERLLERVLIERGGRVGLSWDDERFGVVTWSAPAQGV